MKNTFKFLLSEYWLELCAFSLALVVLLCAAFASGVLPNVEIIRLGQGVVENAVAVIASLIGASILASVIIGFLYLCFLPTVIARKRAHKNLSAIFVLNLLAFPSFGVCWIIALVWAFTKQ